MKSKPFGENSLKEVIMILKAVRLMNQRRILQSRLTRIKNEHADIFTDMRIYGIKGGFRRLDDLLKKSKERLIKVKADLKENQKQMEALQLPKWVFGCKSRKLMLIYMRNLFDGKTDN